jgi:hypothetical protein
MKVGLGVPAERSFLSLDTGEWLGQEAWLSAEVEISIQKIDKRIRSYQG